MSPRRAFWLLAAGLALFALLVFREVVLPGTILFTTDDNVGALALRKAALPRALLGWWDDSVLMGIPQTISINWTNLLLWALPVDFFTTWIHAIDLWVASLFLVLFLRARGQGWAACALGALAAFWVGTNFTLTYAGHIGKFALLIFAAAALWLTEMAVRSRRPAWALLAGGAAGAMFLEQADVALFFSMAIFPYAAYAIWREHGTVVTTWLKLLLPMVVVAGLMAFHPLWTGYQSAVKGVAAMSEEDPQAKWEFATQWSWPPEESIDFVAPGYMGWRSGEPEGPYWGRMGRSAEWKSTGRGFRNFKLENQYLGAIPLAFAVWAVWLAIARRGRDLPGGKDVMFWAAVALVSLLLSFGKHFLLYRVFFMFPMVSSIRNPNKFLHIFQLGVGILAAGGVRLALGADPGHAEAARRTGRACFRVLLAVFGVLVLWALGTLSGWGAAATRLGSEGWGAEADVIVRNQFWALGHGAVMVLCAAAGLYVLLLRPSAPRRARTVAGWAAVGLLAIDALLLARHYVEPMPKSLIRENEVVAFLKQNMGRDRVAVFTQEGFYNAWLTYLFPYHGIPTVNVTQMPRMPADYQAFLGTLGARPLRLWSLAAVRFVLAPAQLWGQIRNDPNLKNSFDIVFAYNVTGDKEGGVKIVPGTAENPGQHCILRYQQTASRYLMMDSWRTVPDAEVLRLLASDEHSALREALLSPAVGGVADHGGEGAIGEVDVRSYAPGSVHIRVSTERPAILRAAEKYDLNWKAVVDGRPAPVLRCDYLMQALALRPGLHDVRLSYAPSRFTLYVQGLAVAICLGAVLRLTLRRRGAAEPGEDEDDEAEAGT